jgi:hypothetical protein
MSNLSRQGLEGQEWLIERTEEVLQRALAGGLVSESELRDLNARIERSKGKDGWLTRTLVGILVGSARIQRLCKRLAGSK